MLEQSNDPTERQRCRNDIHCYKADGQSQSCLGDWIKLMGMKILNISTICWAIVTTMTAIKYQEPDLKVVNIGIGAIIMSKHGTRQKMIYLINEILWREVWKGWYTCYMQMPSKCVWKAKIHYYSLILYFFFQCILQLITKFWNADLHTM